MVIADLRLIETFDGGDCVLKANDLEMISGLQNMPYIGLFGGQYEQSTTGAKDTEQTFDFWGNFLFHPTVPEIWFNSRTEWLLDNVSLSSAGRIQIEEQVKTDLKFMESFCKISVSVSLQGVNRIKISIVLTEKSNTNSIEFSYIWDSTNSELSLVESGGNSNTFGIALNNLLNFEL